MTTILPIAGDSPQLYPVLKRLFDVGASVLALLLLSPVFLLVALLIKLESRGPIFYASKRVGRNYRVFDFYKFRSMRTNADSLVSKMTNLNHYGVSNTVRKDSCGEGRQNGKSNRVQQEELADDRLLFSDEGWVRESDWIKKQEAGQEKTFFKIQNDPRITRVGRFIRNTSIDELPQLLNVLKGDMSIVGNRPLPLYEAEKLTTDEDIARFLAPAGLTGLWQVTERGKKATSNNSRKELDVRYAYEYSFSLDMWILIRTPLALFQSENV
jgi:lipopolysaccharide/colanic/teichoic acid biosynthesis glycosyltransferase